MSIWFIVAILIAWAVLSIPFSVLIGRMIAGPDARWPR